MDATFALRGLLRAALFAFLQLACGSLLAQTASSRSFELKASVEWATNQYLMVYASNEITSGPNVYGRVLGPDASPKGKDFRLSTQLGEMSKPVLAYSPVTERFLVVWGRKLYDEERAEIIGLNVGLNGQVVGQEFRISISDLYDQRPSIAYCPGRDRFLVTWTRGTEYDPEKGIADVYGQLVDGDGIHMLGANFAIASDAKNQFKSDVECDVVHDRFLVAWEDQRQVATQDDIYAQLIASDGARIGENFLVAGTENIERRPVIAGNAKDGGYLLVWEVVLGGSPRMVRQMMDADGKLLGEPVFIGAELGGERNRAAVAYLKKQDMFFVVFDNSGFGELSDGIYGQFVESNGDLRETAFPLTTAIKGQYRPDVAAAKNTFLVVWTDYRDTGEQGGKHNVYEYYGRVIGNDMALSSRWRNPDSK